MENHLGKTGKIDLHTHTAYSDGALKTPALLEKALQAGISTISITDHDCVSALEEGTELSKTSGLEFVPGIEVTSRQKRFQLHFLGYFIDYSDRSFLSTLENLREARVRRAGRIVAKLNRLKIPLKLESVLDRAGVWNSVGRPHIANTMVQEGFAQTYDEVFHKYIGIGRPAYEANHPFPADQAIAMIKNAGGLAILAHPSHYVTEDLLHFLLENGLDGVEVIHPSHSQEEVEYFRTFADSNSILKTGGSDFHGGLKNDDSNLGTHFIEEEWFDQMKSAIMKKSKSKGELIGNL